MDDDLSAFILGMGLRVLADIQAFDFRVTCFTIGVWEGFALCQTTSNKPTSVKAYAMQAFRFVFDFFFFGNPRLVGITLLCVHITWVVATALTQSPPHVHITFVQTTVRPTRNRRQNRRASSPIRLATRSVEPIPPSNRDPPARERTVQFQHFLTGSPNKNEGQQAAPIERSEGVEPQLPSTNPVTGLVPFKRLRVFIEGDDDVSVHVESPVELGTELSSSEPFDEASDDIKVSSDNPLPVPASAPAQSELIDDSANQTSPLTESFVKPPEDDDIDIQPLAQPNPMPTPPLTPADDDKVLHVRIPACEDDTELAAMSEAIQTMEEEVGEVVAAVYQASVVSGHDVEERHDDLESQQTRSTLAEVESIVSTVDEHSLQQKAGIFRSQAQAESKMRDQLLQERLKALAKMKVREAFLLALKARRSHENAVKLHRKAERRYFLANNLRRGLNTLDLHGLRVPEAISRTQQAIRDIVLAGGGRELRVIVGRGNHSPGSKPVLKPALRQALEKSGLKANFDRNPGVLKVAIPARRSTYAASVDG